MATVSGKGLNIFTGAVNSNFSDTRNWSQQRVPSGSDAAIINSNCTFDTNRVLGALIVNPNVTASIGSGRTLTVLGPVNVQGQLAATSNPTINFRGVNNKINSFSPGNSSVYYDAAGYQTIAGTTYFNLYAQSGTKQANGNLIVSGGLRMFSIGDVINLDAFDLNVLGVTYFGKSGGGSGGVIQKRKPGRVVLEGQLQSDNDSGLSFVDYQTTSGVITELQSGTNLAFYNANNRFDFGTNTVIFSTRNQNLVMNGYGGPGLIFAGPVIVTGSIAVTGSMAITLRSTATISGSATDKFVIGSAGSLNVATTASQVAGGILLDPTSSGTVNYSLNGPATLPYTSYFGLGIFGTGSFFTTGDLLIRGDVWMYGKGALDVGNYNLTILGGTRIGGSSNSGIIRKTGPGTVRMNGISNIDANVGPILDFSGNPTVFFSGSITGNVYFSNVSPINSGTGSWYFTSNGTINIGGVSNSQAFSGPVFISGSSRVTSTIPLTFTSSLNGTTGSAVFANASTLTYRNGQQPMLTGSLDVSSSLNTFIYDLSGSQNITGGTYRNLTIAGSGSKTLMGNVSVLNTLSTGSLITLITGSYTLTNP
jgi:hypothetical protein